jgi:redox-sensitive bicupin YhaK (pirin superfamily)
MIQTIRSNDRYHTESDWLSTKWHFSFADYHDPQNVQFGPLRVFNDDTVAPGGGFPQHPHRDMEIITYVIDGALQHQDNLGNTGVIRPGEIQRMSAGTGVRHSEFNASQTDPVHFLQLWIMPAVQRLQPSWEQKSFSLQGREGKLLPLAVPVGDGEKSEAGTVQIHQDATIYTSLLRPSQSVSHPVAAGRRAYIFVIRGSLNLNGQTLMAGDQARVHGESTLQMSVNSGQGGGPADFLLIDLP